MMSVRKEMQGEGSRSWKRKGKEGESQAEEIHGEQASMEQFTYGVGGISPTTARAFLLCASAMSSSNTFKFSMTCRSLRMRSKFF